MIQNRMPIQGVRFFHGESLMLDFRKKLVGLFADKIIAVAKKTPYFHLEGYMERFWLVAPSKYLPFSIRVHHILRSDQDRHLHTHPWDYATLILKGGYWEVTPVEGSNKNNINWYGPGSFLKRKADSSHRLVIPEGSSAWTLFIHSKKKREWGFMVDGQQVFWREYLGQWDTSQEGNPGPVTKKFGD